MAARVLFLTQYYPPETGAPQARISEMARHLHRQGFVVEVLTGMPSYPTGRVFDGYRGKFLVVEKQDGIRVVRTPVYPTASVWMPARMANYLSFVLSSLLPGALRVRRPDVIICESPPLALGISALVLKMLLRSRLIFNVSDLWPDSAVHMDVTVPGWALRVASVLERACYRGSDAKTGQSPGIVNALRARDASPSILIPNGCDTELYRPERACSTFRREVGGEGKILIGYAGLLGAAQGVEMLLEVASDLKDDPRLRFVIVGDGPERALIADRAKSMKNVHFAGHAARERMPGIVASFDVAFIPLRYRIPGALPSKVYEAMACEVPILLAADGDARDVVERASAGLVVAYEAEAIRNAIRRLVDHPELRMSLGTQARKYALAHHERKVIAARMGRVIDGVVSKDQVALRALEAEL